MSRKKTIIRGTFILTIAGFLSRFMGFFYRIFLSRAFGEESVGLYQLIFPVYSLCFSITTAGIETAVSRTVARKVSLGKKEEAQHILLSGLLFSFLLSCVCMVLLQQNCIFIADALLGDARCRPLLSILSYTIPCSAVHSCIGGYCYGLKQTRIPASAQLVEQTTRIAAVWLIYFLMLREGKTPSITLAVCGLVIGELTSALYSVQALHRQEKHLRRLSHPVKSLFAGLGELLPLSVPLTANRILITLLQSIEAVSIPGKLQSYHYSTSEALSLYGVLNGMALPCILFPSAITSSVSIMLMPTVAEIQASDNRNEMLDVIKKVSGACFILGLFCCLGFLLTGGWIGQTVFGSAAAGKFILTLAWICPFLYTNGAFLSIINGLGKTTSTFLINAFSLLLRIAGVFFAIPQYGMYGYLWGLLISQLAVSVLAAVVILRSI